MQVRRLDQRPAPLVDWRDRQLVVLVHLIPWQGEEPQDMLHSA